MPKYYILIWSIWTLSLLCRCTGDTVVAVTCMSKGNAEISYLKESYTAGDQIKFKLETEGLEKEDIIIVWDGKFGEQFFDKTVHSEKFFFVFPDSISIYSGFVSIRVVHCNKVLSQAQTYIKSLHPNGAIESYLGPKTLAIDQSMRSMLCLIPTDKFGNALEDNVSVSFNTKYNSLSTINVSKGIENLVSFLFIENNQQVGKVLLGAKCVDTYIDEQEVSIVQGPMQDVKINIVEMHPYGDQRQLVHLNTDIIYDVKGNVVADGTSIVYIVYQEGAMHAQYQAYTVSGIANVFIENPKTATEWEVSIAGAPNGNAIHLKFEADLESIPLRIEKNHLVVGPVVGSLDQYVPDGTKVVVTFNHLIYKETVIEHGFSRLEIPPSILNTEEITCEVIINGRKVKLIY